MCLLRCVGCCNRRVFTDTTCTSSKFFEQQHHKSMHIPLTACSFSVEALTLVVSSINAEWKLHIPSSFPFRWTEYTWHISAIAHVHDRPEWISATPMYPSHGPLLHCFMTNTMPLGRWIVLFTRWQACIGYVALTFLDVRTFCLFKFNFVRTPQRIVQIFSGCMCASVSALCCAPSQDVACSVFVEKQAQQAAPYHCFLNLCFFLLFSSTWSQPVRCESRQKNQSRM